MAPPDSDGATERRSDEATARGAILPPPRIIPGIKPGPGVLTAIDDVDGWFKIAGDVTAFLQICNRGTSDEATERRSDEGGETGPHPGPLPPGDGENAEEVLFVFEAETLVGTVHLRGDPARGIAPRPINFNRMRAGLSLLPSHVDIEGTKHPIRYLWHPALTANMAPYDQGIYRGIARAVQCAIPRVTFIDWTFGWRRETPAKPRTFLECLSDEPTWPLLWFYGEKAKYWADEEAPAVIARALQGREPAANAGGSGHPVLIYPGAARFQEAAASIGKALGLTA